MALLKLISDGRSTYLELDGKTMSSCVDAVTFSHQSQGENKGVMLHLDINLSRAHDSSEKGSDGIFQDNSSFDLAYTGMEQHEEELRKMHSSKDEIIARVLGDGKSQVQ